VVEPLLVDASRSNWTVLEQDGVVRIDNVLSHELCAACLDYINQALLVGVEDQLETASTNHGELTSDFGGSKVSVTCLSAATAVTCTFGILV
jgi:hypothetical protein